MLGVSVCHCGKMEDRRRERESDRICRRRQRKKAMMRDWKDRVKGASAGFRIQMKRAFFDFLKQVVNRGYVAGKWEEM